MWTHWYRNKKNKHANYVFKVRVWPNVYKTGKACDMWERILHRWLTFVWLNRTGTTLQSSKLVNSLKYIDNQYLFVGLFVWIMQWPASRDSQQCLWWLTSTSPWRVVKAWLTGPGTPKIKWSSQRASLFPSQQVCDWMYFTEPLYF